MVCAPARARECPASDQMSHQLKGEGVAVKVRVCVTGTLTVRVPVGEPVRVGTSVRVSVKVRVRTWDTVGRVGVSGRVQVPLGVGDPLGTPEVDHVREAVREPEKVSVQTTKVGVKVGVQDGEPGFWRVPVGVPVVVEVGVELRVSLGGDRETERVRVPETERVWLRVCEPLKLRVTLYEAV